MPDKNSLSRRKFIRTGALGFAGLAALPFEKMQERQLLQRTIPSTGEKIPTIGLGSWLTFDVGNSEAERAPMRLVLKEFLALGGKVVDSSPMYGRSERVIGDLAAELNATSQLWVSTKVWTSGQVSGRQQMDNSTRLFRKNPSVIHVHNLLDFDTHIKTLRLLRESGKIKYLGITHYLVSAHEEVARVIKKEPLDFLQINYSIRTRNAENYLLPLAADKGLAVIINRPFEQGNLFNVVRSSKLPAFVAEWEIRTWASFFLKYILSNPNVTCAIPATSQVTHLRENMAAGLGALPGEKGRKMMVAYFDNL